MSLHILTAARIAAPVGPGLFSSLMASMDVLRGRRAAFRRESSRIAESRNGLRGARSGAKTPIPDTSFRQPR